MTRRLPHMAAAVLFLGCVGGSVAKVGAQDRATSPSPFLAIYGLPPETVSLLTRPACLVGQPLPLLYGAGYRITMVCLQEWLASHDGALETALVTVVVPPRGPDASPPSVTPRNDR